MLRLIIAVSVVLLSGCASSDPTLANYVYRQGQGIYKAGDIKDAVKQCELENKQIEIITSTQEYSYVLKRNFPSYIFKCIDK